MAAPKEILKKGLQPPMAQLSPKQQEINRKIEEEKPPSFLDKAKKLASDIGDELIPSDEKIQQRRGRVRNLAGMKD